MGSLSGGVGAATTTAAAIRAAAAPTAYVRIRRRAHLACGDDAVSVNIDAIEQRQPLVREFLEVDVTVRVPVGCRRGGATFGAAQVVQRARFGTAQIAVFVGVVFGKLDAKRALEFVARDATVAIEIKYLELKPFR